MEITKDDRRDFALNTTLMLSVVIFFIGVILGKFGPVLIANDKCYPIIGCNVGFFGYDAVLHFFSGIIDATAIICFMKAFPKFSLFHKTFWKNLLIIASLTALISLCWEVGEFSHDQFRMNVLHENLTSPKNHLDQPSDADTMGDMTFAEVASILAIFTFRKTINKNTENKSS